jgi:hypothetical protein
MNDNSYRPNLEPPAKSAPLTPASDTSVPAGITEVEPPFTDYEGEKGRPFAVDYYELGELWSEGDMYSQGYIPEVKTINEYLTDAISNGDIANTIEAARNEIKRIEKINNIKVDQRKTMRLGVVAEYIRFMRQTDFIKKESGRNDRI